MSRWSTSCHSGSPILRNTGMRLKGGTGVARRYASTILSRKSAPQRRGRWKISMAPTCRGLSWFSVRKNIRSSIGIGIPTASLKGVGGCGVLGLWGCECGPLAPVCTLSRKLRRDGGYGLAVPLPSARRVRKALCERRCEDGGVSVLWEMQTLSEDFRSSYGRQMTDSHRSRAEQSVRGDAARNGAEQWKWVKRRWSKGRRLVRVGSWEAAR